VARLYVLSGDDVGAVHELASGAVVGRAKDVELVVRGASISRRHARFEERDGRWFVVDLGSANGVRVGGHLCDEAELEDGTEILLGEVAVRFRAPAAAQPRPSQAESLPPPAPRAPEPQTGEIELEGDWDLAATVVRPPASGAPAPSSAPERAAPARQRSGETRARRAAALGGPVAGARGTTSGGRILQYQRVEDHGGLLGSELSQQSLGVRLALYALVAMLFVGLAWLAYWLTSSARG